MDDIAKHSFSLHEELAAEFASDSRFDPEYRYVDSLDLAFDAEEASNHDDRVAWINQFLDSRLSDWKRSKR